MKKSNIIMISSVLVIVLIIGAVLLITSGREPKERKLQTAEEIQNMLNTIYSSENIELPQLDIATIDVTDEAQVTTFTGLKSNDNVEELVISAFSFTLTTATE